ncbi:MAG: hypothetical protein WCK01_03135 [Candidatus Uhrbacteria bacterium]
MKGIIMGPSSSLEKCRHTFWESRFPGHGTKIMEALGVVYEAQLQLNPPVSDLEARAQRAIFWRPIKSVSTMDIMSVPQHTSLWKDLDDRYGDGLRDVFDDRYEDSLAASIYLAFQRAFQGPFAASLWTSLYFVVGASIVGNMDLLVQFQPLLGLCALGNFPIGFDEEGNLLLLVAS